MMSNVGPLRTMSFSMMPTVSASGRTYVPVKPSQYVFSQFQYVAGIPARNGQEGVSVDKIKILNTLIDQLISMKQKNVEPKITSRGQISDGQIEALITQYQDQIRNAAAVAEQMPYKPSIPQPGSVINLVA